MASIEATDATSLPLPPLAAAAARFDEHGTPERVLYADGAAPLPERLAHGEVLVRMLAAPVGEDDLNRVATPLAVLNDFPPFNRTANKWEPTALPATGGGEGVGIVIATAKNVPTLHDCPLEVKDWVVVRPDARLAPLGTWSTLVVADASRLLKVDPSLMPVAHLANASALATAYRLLEDYGSLRPGDAIIQNAAELPTGQAVIQLCKLLKIRTVNLVADDDNFDGVKATLMEMGATHVYRDNAAVFEQLSAAPLSLRVAYDALGGEAGRRLAVALRPGASLVLHSLHSGAIPKLAPSLLMYQLISLHGFSLPQWVSEHGTESYLQMLNGIGELAKGGKLDLHTRSVDLAALTAAGGDPQGLVRALIAHKGIGGGGRERITFHLGEERDASEMYFELQAKVRELLAAQGEVDDEVAAAAAVAPPPAAVSASPKRPKASERWGDAAEMLRELKLEMYVKAFEEEEMTSLELLEEIVERADGERELVDALKEMGIKKMGHRQAIVGAVVGKI